ncbi:MAG: galactokinase [Lachnospiraceae bacterium]|nr:galactokinase [Lachnospiraceae bacterium]
MKRMMQEKFAEIYGGEGELFFAPGRVNMIGEHTDYNGGHVFPCALTLGTYAAVKKRGDDVIRMASLNMDDAAIREMTIASASEKSGSWTDYPRGVIWAMAEKGNTIDTGFDVLYYGNIPAGSGLSSSASLEVLTALYLRELYGFDKVEQIDLAFIGQSAESDFVGMKCGIMDQFASAMGKENKAMFLDTNTMKFDYLPLALSDAKIVITNSMVKHELASSEYNTRRAECEKAVGMLKAKYDIATLGELTPEQFEEGKDLITDETIAKRAKHAVYENARTFAAVEALKNNDIATFGKLMNESHVSLRDDYAVSCPEIDELTRWAWDIEGVIGSRITGGGFGGCTVSIIKNDAIDTYKDAVFAKYKEQFDKELEFYVVDPGEGAHKL